jgi:glucose/arabinose dehydrogenase
MKKLIISLAILTFIFAAFTLSLFMAKDERTITRSDAQQAAPTMTVLATDLRIPWALAFLPNGNIIFTERAGKVRMLANNQIVDIATINGVHHGSEGGLLGIAVHPQFATNNYVYIYFTYQSSGQRFNKLNRYTFTNNQLTNETTIIGDIPGAGYHDGGRIKFGPDGFLYITTGDAGNTAAAQNTNSLAGKILRVTDTGAPAPGNPFNNRVWSYGHRHPQGIAWDGTTMYATEHGKSDPSCCDELNRIEAGKNYGWPNSMGDQAASGTVKNLMHSGPEGSPSWAPAGTVFYNGSIFFGGLRGQALFEAKVNGNTATIVNQHFKGQLGRIREVIVGPDNQLYITTSNHDGRGTPKAGDDKIIRVSFGNQPTVAPTAPPPTNITPTFQCLAGQPCTSPLPSTTPPIGGQNPTTNPNPSGTQPTTNPNPSVSPCPTDGTSSIATEKHKKHKHKHKKKHKENNGGGFLEQFLKFLLRLIEWLISGGQLPPPTNPDPVQPAPDPTVAPCPEPTNQPAPTSGTSPTTAPTDVPTPTLAAAASPTVAPSTSQYIVIGSHPGWAHDVYPPGASFDYTPWTHIYHFGALVTPTGTINLDTLSDSKVKAGVAGAHAAGKKILAVIGSEGNGDEFAKAAANNTTRAAMVKNIAEHVKKYGYDGFSIDWEEDVNSANYIALHKEMRAEIDKMNPRPLFLTDVISGLVPPATAAQVKDSVDIISMMSYWSDGMDQLNAYQGAGIPANKLMMGIGISPSYRDQSVANVQQKINTVKQKGLRGVEVWAIQGNDLKGGFKDPRLQPLRDFTAGK